MSCQGNDCEWFMNSRLGNRYNEHYIKQSHHQRNRRQFDGFDDTAIKEKRKTCLLTTTTMNNVFKLLAVVLIVAYTYADVCSIVCFETPECREPLKQPCFNYCNAKHSYLRSHRP